MEIKLKRIKYDQYDNLVEKINVSTFFNKQLNGINKDLDDFCEPVFYNGKEITLDIDENEYNKLQESSITDLAASSALAKRMFNDFKMGDSHLPINLVYEKEIWTYLNLTVFFKLNKIKYFDSKSQVDGKKLLSRISRIYFCKEPISKIDRTGLRYLLVLAYATEIENDFKYTNIALRFIDPFKALHECTIGKNSLILKSFAFAIEQLKYDPRIKNSTYKTIIPKHIRNYACANFLDSYTSIEELGSIFAEQIRKIIE